MINNKSFIVVFLQLLQTILAAATSIYIARLLGAQDFGRYVYLITSASILPLFVGLGAEHVFIMEASKAHKLIPFFFGNALILRTTLTSLSLMIIALILILLSIPDFWAVMLITTGSLLAVFPNPLFLSFYRVKGIHIRPWLICFTSPISFLSYLLLIGSNRTKLEWVSFGFCFSHILTLLLFLIDMRKRVKIHISIRYLKRYFKRGLVFSISQGFDFAFARLDIFLLQFISGSYSVGIYAAGQKVVSLLQIIPSSFHIVELPEFHRLSGNANLLTAKFRSLRKLLFELGLLFFGLLALNATFVINLLFSNEYSSASIIVILLSVSGLFLFANYPYYMLAEAINKIKQRMYLRIITFFATVILIFSCIKLFGIPGAAIGLLAGQILFMTLLHILTKSINEGINAILKDSRMLLISIIAVIPAIYSHSLFDNEIASLILGSILYILIFLTLGYQLKWIEKIPIIEKMTQKYACKLKNQNITHKKNT